jgi:uncharacterized membrane protein
MSRFDGVDALRGLAMVWMTAFHFCFDLNHFGYWRQDFYHDPFWLWQRTCILSLFLLCAGMGQAIAVAQGQSWLRFFFRWRLVVGCSLLVSAGSWLMYPQTFIYFGVLHGIAVMLIIARLTAQWGRWLWFLGGLSMAIKIIAAYAIETMANNTFVEAFNSPYLNWLGLVTRKPITEDYVPLLPWMGVMWWGVAIGNGYWPRTSGEPRWHLPEVLTPLAVMGRWSLTYYMLHQPLMISGLLLLGWFASK